MPLVPETKMADARKQSVSGTHWPGELRDPCSKLRLQLQFRPAFFWAHNMTRILYKYARLPTLTLFSHVHLQGQQTFSSVTSSENTLILSFQLTAVHRHKNVYAMQPFSYLLHLFGEIFPAAKTTEISSNHRKKHTNNMGEDTFLLIYTIKIL